MQKINLIPMTDFVDEIDNLVPRQTEQDFDAWIYKQFTIVKNYAKFLRQPLTLSMFVPCDENGNVLNDPGLIPGYELERYRKAKEKVLFIFPFTIDISTIKHHIGQERTVEYFAKFYNAQLTESAIKKFGL